MGAAAMDEPKQIGSLANQVIANLTTMIAEKKAQANVVADKIGGLQHHKSLGAEHERLAEHAQWLAGKQAAWERLQDSGFAT